MSDLEVYLLSNYTNCLALALALLDSPALTQFFMIVLDRHQSITYIRQATVIVSHNAST